MEQERSQHLYLHGTAARVLTSGHPPETRTRVLTSGHPPGTLKLDIVCGRLASPFGTAATQTNRGEAVENKGCMTS